MTENVDATVNEDEVSASVDNDAPEAGVEEVPTEEVPTNEVVAEVETAEVETAEVETAEVETAEVETAEVETAEVVAMDAEIAVEESGNDGVETPETTEVLEAISTEDEEKAAAVTDDTSVRASEDQIVPEPDGSEIEAVAVEAVAVDAAETRDGADDATSGTAVPVADDEDSDEVDESDSSRVVRMLAVGQQVGGVVRRIADFGAFVDIGVGRDGLIHISELSPRRVAKVSDILSEKQEIQPWIKKLDRKRNRISLTLIDPEMKTIRDLESGEIVQGTVTRILPYGAFIDIGIGRDALLHVREMSTGFVEKPEDVVQVGETIEGRIIEVSRRRGRVDLSLKGLRDEPEPEMEFEAEVVEEAVEDENDPFEDVEVLSPMELAFKKAVEAEGTEIQVTKTKRGKRDRRQDSRTIQDEIISRTLDTGLK